jgi:hypothetical protein
MNKKRHYFNPTPALPKGEGVGAPIGCFICYSNLCFKIAFKSQLFLSLRCTKVLPLGEDLGGIPYTNNPKNAFIAEETQGMSSLQIR